MDLFFEFMDENRASMLRQSGIDLKSNYHWSEA